MAGAGLPFDVGNALADADATGDADPDADAAAELDGAADAIGALTTAEPSAPWQAAASPRCARMSAVVRFVDIRRW